MRFAHPDLLWLLALVPLLAILLGCARGDPRDALSRLDAFASRVTGEALDRSWRDAFGEDAPKLWFLCGFFCRRMCVKIVS